MSPYLKLVDIISQRDKQASENLIKAASEMWLKEAFLKDLSDPFNKETSQRYFYYTAWATLFALGQTELEPTDSTLPSDFRGLRRQLRRRDSSLDKMIMDEWNGSGGAEWATMLSKLASTFRGSFMDLGTDLFSRYFLIPHGRNKSEPEASRSSAGKTQMELNGGVWYRLNKDPSKFTDIASAIKYVGNYIRRVYDPKSPHFTKREIMPGDLKRKRYIVDLNTDENAYGDPIENIEDSSSNTTVYDQMELFDGTDPLVAQKEVDNLITRALEGKAFKENATYNMSANMLQKKKDLLFLSASVWRMLDEDWAMLIAKRWDEDIVQDIVMTCSEVSSKKLAPMIIKKYKFMNTQQLRLFASFVDNCMDADAKIFNPKIKTKVKKGKSDFAKRMRKRTKSIPQWVNLFLAVNGGFTYQGIKIEGDLHSSSKKWGTSMANIAENSTEPEDYIAALWESCKLCLPITTMGVTPANFKSTMMKYIDIYLNIREKEMQRGDIQLSVVNRIYKDRIKSYFKDSDKSYPYSLVAIPMAEGVRMSLILSVMPHTFEEELTTSNIVTCTGLLEKLFSIPQNVVNAVRDLSSELVVDDIIDIVEEEVKASSREISVAKTPLY